MKLTQDTNPHDINNSISTKNKLLPLPAGQYCSTTHMKCYYFLCININIFTLYIYTKHAALGKKTETYLDKCGLQHCF